MHVHEVGLKSFFFKEINEVWDASYQSDIGKKSLVA